MAKKDDVLKNENESVLVEEPQPIAKTSEPNEQILEQYVTIVVPRAMGKAPQVVYVAVNGKVWNIPRGKPVTIPKYVAIVLEQQQRAQARYEQDVSESYDNANLQYLNSLER